MSVKNKYVKHAHVSEVKFRQIILLFSEDLSATQISHLTKTSRPTVSKYLTAIRLRILELSLIQSAPLVGQVAPKGQASHKLMRVILEHGAAVAPEVKR
jgi:hypothetical protein